MGYPEDRAVRDNGHVPKCSCDGEKGYPRPIFLGIVPKYRFDGEKGYSRPTNLREVSLSVDIFVKSW